ncbi:MAG: lipocalin family protein [Desulfobulbales bacterium]
MKLFQSTPLLFCALILFACTGKEPHPPLQTVNFVNLQKYAGRWYEIARYPHSFEQGCSAVTADYALEKDGALRVTNRCLLADEDGKFKKAVGRAKVVDPETNARLKVTFFWPFYGDYWILLLDPDYRYVIVGTPSRKYLWILSRSPTIDRILLHKLIEEIKRMGYDPDRLIMTDQSANFP